MNLLRAVLVPPLLVFGFVASDCDAQERITLFNSPAAVTLDGLLTEPCWQQAQVISNFLQRDPREGEPATEKTEVRVVLYQKALYIGVVAYDANPNLIVAKEMRRDGDVEADDSITIILDTYLDHRNAFYFAFNANGARKDALVVDENSSLNVNWNGVWDVKAVVTDRGWQAEVMIPLDTLRCNFRLSSHLSFGGSYATNRAHYQTDSFTTHELTSRVVYAFSNRVNLQVFSQWNNESKAANVYVRLHIIPKIGSDIYGVFNQLIDTSGLRRSNLGRAVRGKIMYPFYF